MMMKEGVDMSQQHEQQEVLAIDQELLQLHESILAADDLYDDLDRPLTQEEKDHFQGFWSGNLLPGQREEAELV